MNHIVGEKKEWNKTAITPGTKFMDKLNKSLTIFLEVKKRNMVLIKLFLQDQMNREKENTNYLVILGDYECHKHEVTVVYGLDADLIMLCLNHLRISKNIYLYRETPEFVKSIDKSINPNESYLLDIPYLAQEYYIRNEWL